MCILPPKKALILLWLKNNPSLSTQQLQKILDINEITDIYKFYRKSRKFPIKPAYVKKEIEGLLALSLRNRISFPDAITFTINSTRYISKNKVLKYIKENQHSFGFRFQHFLACFYKHLSPDSEIRCFHCRKRNKNILFLSTYTPKCVQCYEEGKRIRWKYRKINVTKIRYKKCRGGKGFRSRHKQLFLEFIQVRQLLPLVSRKRINTIKNVTRFLTLEQIVSFPRSKINYRILSKEENGYYKIRHKHRPRTRK